MRSSRFAEYCLYHQGSSHVSSEVDSGSDSGSDSGASSACFSPSTEFPPTGVVSAALSEASWSSPSGVWRTISSTCSSTMSLATSLTTSGGVSIAVVCSPSDGKGSISILGNPSPIEISGAMARATSSICSSIYSSPRCSSWAASIWRALGLKFSTASSIASWGVIAIVSIRSSVFASISFATLAASPSLSRYDFVSAARALFLALDVTGASYACRVLRTSARGFPPARSDSP